MGAAGIVEIGEGECSARVIEAVGESKVDSSKACDCYRLL